MKKRYWIPLLLVALCLSVLLLPSEAEAAEIASGQCGNHVTWVLDDSGTLTISGTGKMTDYWWDHDSPWYEHRASIQSVVVMPGVTSIGENAFGDCNHIMSITIPEGITSIGESAFDGCSSLLSITLPDSVRSIGNDAFWGCVSLTEITIPYGVTTLEEDIFWNCSNLTKVVLPDSITTFEGWVFVNCESLTQIVLPNNLVTIGQSAFSGCDRLAEIHIPSSVTTIGSNAFSGCSSLTEIYIPENVTSIGLDALGAGENLVRLIVAENNPVFHSRGNCVIETASKKLVAGCNGSVIPDDDSITCIGAYAFYWTRNQLTEITIPESVTSIERYAFGSCHNLRTIILPDGLVSIDYNAFYSCHSLTEIVIPENVVSVGNEAFVHCTQLKSAVIPDSVTQLGTSAFQRCSNLTGIVLGRGLTIINANTFFECDKLRTVLFLGTQAEAEAISIVAGNEALESATWHYNVQRATYLGQDCFFCPDCQAYYLPDGEKMCDHQFSAWTYSKYSQHSRTCALCQKEEVEEHQYDDGVLTQEVTCGDQGQLLYTCQQCGYQDWDFIDATGEHTYDSKRDPRCNVCDRPRPVFCIGNTYSTFFRAKGSLVITGFTEEQIRVSIVDPQSYNCQIQFMFLQTGTYKILIKDSVTGEELSIDASVFEHVYEDERDGSCDYCTRGRWVGCVGGSKNHYYNRIFQNSPVLKNCTPEQVSMICTEPVPGDFSITLTFHQAGEYFLLLEDEETGKLSTQEALVFEHVPGPAATESQPQRCIHCNTILVPATGSDVTEPTEPTAPTKSEDATNPTKPAAPNTDDASAGSGGGGTLLIAVIAFVAGVAVGIGITFLQKKKS